MHNCSDPLLAKSQRGRVQALERDATVDHADSRDILGKAIVSGAEALYPGL